MADKYLTEKEWKGFSKNAAYKDAPLLKAFAALEKAEKSGPQDQLKALDELEKQADSLLKAHKADKPLANYLGDVDKAAQKLRKEAGSQLEKSNDEDDEDGPGSVLLDPKKLLNQLNLCKRDPERSVNFGFVDAKDKQPAAFAMSPKISGRKLYAKLQAELGVKTGAFGTAWVDGTSLMLQLDKPLGGLVKKVRAPIKACGFRITKAVLWNEDGTVFEQDEADEGVDEIPPAPPLQQGGPSEIPTAPPLPINEPTVGPKAGTGEPNELGEKFKARLTALLPGMKAAAPALAVDIKLKVSEAGVFARKKDFDAANALLDQVDRLLDGGGGAIPTAPPLDGPGDEGKTVDPALAFNARLTALMPRVKEVMTAAGPTAQDIKLQISEAGVLARKKEFEPANALLDRVEPMLAEALASARGQTPPQEPGTTATPTVDEAVAGRLREAARAWQPASEAVDQQISALQAALKNSGDAELVEISNFGLNGISGNFKVKLMASLRELQSAQGPALRAAAAKALPIAAGLQNHLETEPRVAACDDNPFGVAVSIRKTMGGALSRLIGALESTVQV